MRQEMVSAAQVAATAAKVSAAVAAQPLHVSPPFLCPIRLLLAPLPLLPSPPSDSVRPPHDIELASELCCEFAARRAAALHRRRFSSRPAASCSSSSQCSSQIAALNTSALRRRRVHVVDIVSDVSVLSRKLFERINQVCTRFLHKSIQYLGSIEQDELILAALKKHQSTLEFAPSSAGARDFRRLAVATNDLSPIDHASGGVQFFVERR